MSDENTTPQSGSRWEPRPDVSDAPTPPVPTTRSGEAGGPETAAPGPLPGGTDRSSWATRIRGRGGVLVGAAALVLAAGVGGFAAGEVAHHDGDRPAFGVGYQPHDAQFPGLPPGAGDDDGGVEGPGSGQNDDGGQPGGQLGGGSDDGGAQQGSSL